MKKKDFVTLILGTVGGILFALGMCMCLLPQWGAFRTGVILGGLGLLVLLAMLLVRRRMEHKPMIRFSLKAFGTAALGVIGALALGVGMCLVMVWNLLLPGIAVGVVGILLLICLIPVCKGLE